MHPAISHRPVALLPGLALLGLVACGSEPGDGEAIASSRFMASQCGAGKTPKAPYFGKEIDDYAEYVPQAICDPAAKPGVVAFSQLVLPVYPCTSNLGISRSCDVGTVHSEHWEGRGWDWGLDYPHPAATALLDWLLATDEYGNRHAMARRLGVMYIIWGDKIWRAYSPSKEWEPCNGMCAAHNDHVHFSFSWAGARKQTSYWSPPPPPEPPPAPPPPSPNQQPAGQLESASCAGFRGWAQDPEAKGAAVQIVVEVDRDAPTAVDQQLIANVHRDELCQTLGSCAHGFEMPVPSALRDGAVHTVQVFALDPGTGQRTRLAGSPQTFSCSGPEHDPGTGTPIPFDRSNEVIASCSLGASPLTGAPLALWLLLALGVIVGLRRR